MSVKKRWFSMISRSNRANNALPRWRNYVPEVMWKLFNVVDHFLTLCGNSIQKYLQHKWWNFIDYKLFLKWRWFVNIDFVRPITGSYKDCSFLWSEMGEYTTMKMLTEKINIDEELYMSILNVPFIAMFYLR